MRKSVHLQLCLFVHKNFYIKPEGRIWGKCQTVVSSTRIIKDTIIVKEIGIHNTVVAFKTQYSC